MPLRPAPLSDDLWSRINGSSSTKDSLEILSRRCMAPLFAALLFEITIVPQFGGMPYPEAERSTRLFAREGLPVIQKIDAKLHPAALP